MTAPLLAYAVTEFNDNTGGIVFARRRSQAVRRGADEYADGDTDYMLCYRVKWADSYASEGVIPAKVMIANGWHFECHGCGATIDYDWLEEKRRPIEGVLGTQNGAVFCCARCKLRHERIERKKAKVGDDFLDVMRQRIRQRFGDVTIIEDGEIGRRPHVYVIEQGGAYSVGQACMSFEFPGMKYGPATARYEFRYSFRFDGIGPSLILSSCLNGDVEAFQAFAAATKNRTVTDA